MKNRNLLIGAGLIGLVVVLGVGWYLVSPLFISNSVDEAFPFEMPAAAEMAAMSDAEMKALEDEFMLAVPDEATLEDLSEADRDAVETAVMEAAAAVMSDTMMAEAMPETAVEWIQAASGSFVGADDFHQGAGSAAIFQQGEQRVLRLEEFSVTNGPDLHVLLSTNPNPTSRADIGEYIDLGSLKGNMGNQNYEIPADVDVSQYQSVVIYCMPFHVVFATATLNG